jgi:uncharacterized protein YjbI with pentapeptide repeats
MAVCLIHEINSEINCPRDALKGDPDGLCLLHSRQENKDQNGKFTDEVKQKIGADDYNFRGVFFPGLVDFSWKKFNIKADFSWATFHNAKFSWATFKEVYFHNTTFQEADFFGATIHRAYFSWTTFHRALFINTTFHNADFFKATFNEFAFSGAIIEGCVKLVGIRSEEKTKDKHPVDLRIIEFGENGILKLKDLSLSMVRFSGTDLRFVKFDHVTWASWWWRSAVYDEILLHQQRWSKIVYVLKHGGVRRKINSRNDGKDSPKKISFNTAVRHAN